MDIATGFRTRNVLCQPLRSNRGGGKIIGAVQMINKADGFDDSDEELLTKCVQKIADDLHQRFEELLHAAELFAGLAIFVNSKPKRGFDAETKSSSNGRQRDREAK